MLCANEFYENASQSGDSNIDQVAYWQTGCFEVNPNHCSDFEIDKQQQEVPEFSSPPMHHADECSEGRPHGRRTKREQRQIVKGIDQKRSECVGEIAQLRVKAGGEPVQPVR